MAKRHARLDRRRWERTRRIVFARDGYRCRCCGKVGALECDHIVSLNRDPDQDPYDPDGCQTLARGCHIRKTAGENRRPSTPAELRWRALIAERLQNDIA